jgi:hypothetical protein
LALTTEAATRRALDTKLDALMFTPQNKARFVAMLTDNVSQGAAATPPDLLPPQVTAMASSLVHTDGALATLLTEQARSSSLTQMRSFNSKVDALSATVKTDMKLIRKALAVPPTASQEP